MRTVFYYHVAATQITYLICHLIFDLYRLQFLLGNIYCLIQIRIEVTDNSLPCNCTICNTV